MIAVHEIIQLFLPPIHALGVYDFFCKKDGGFISLSAIVHSSSVTYMNEHDRSAEKNCSSHPVTLIMGPGALSFAT
jgi:hypothetical protein